MSAVFAPVDLTRVADVLEGLSREIEELGEDLCSDPAIVANHITHLQAIDRIAQYQRALSALLRSDCDAAAVRQLGIEDLKQRLIGA